MAKVFCFRHPQYDGSESPVLSCKTCCGIFVAAVKEQAAKLSSSDPEMNMSDWFNTKRQQGSGNEKIAAQQNKSTWKPGFSPDTI